MRIHHRKRCVHCQQMFQCRDKVQKFCGHACARAANVDVLKANAAKTNWKRSTHRMSEHTKALYDAWPEMPWECFQQVIRYGKTRWAVGRASGDRAGYARGWAEALGEKKGRAA